MDKNALRLAAQKYRDNILPPYDIIMDMDGFGAICCFSETFSGSAVYVPSLRTIFSGCIEGDIVASYNGKNTKQLARNYGYTERYLQRIVRRNR